MRSGKAAKREEEMGSLRQRFEDWMAAVAFAEAGDHLTARWLLTQKPAARKVARKRPRSREKMAARAPLAPRG